MNHFERDLHNILVLIEASDTESSLLNILAASDANINPNAVKKFIRDELVLGEISNIDNIEYIKHLPLNVLKSIIAYVTNIIRNDRNILKYRPYFIIQIAKGNLKLSKLGEDLPQYIETIRKFAVLSKKKSWSHSRNIYEYDNIHDLVAKTLDFSERVRESESFNKDSIILFTSEYHSSNSNAIEIANLLGLPAEDKIIVTRTYWLRRILTMNGAVKYGKGTQWCTSSKPVEGRDHPTDSYLGYGLFQIERKITQYNVTKDDRQLMSFRQPVLQISPNVEIADIENSSKRPAGTMKKFCIDAAKALTKNLSHEMLAVHEYETRPGRIVRIDDNKIYQYLIATLLSE